MIQKFELNGPRAPYVNGRGSALRSRSPNQNSIGEQDPTYHNQSPMRSQSPLDFRRQQASITEEELFEERRGEELRRQIRMKELELEQIAQNKDRLQMRINSTLGFGAQVNPQATAVRPVSPLMPTVQQIYSKPIPVEPQVQIQNQRRSQSPSDYYVNQRNRSSSPLRQNRSRQQSINEPLNQVKHSVDKQSAVKNEMHLQNPPIINNKSLDYIQQLNSDNTQLQRRLELVMSELDRVTREKAQNFDRFQSLLTQTQFQEKSLRTEQNQDQITEALHENIFVSREENKKIQCHIADSDLSRQEIITKLRLLRNERDRLVQSSEELSAGLQHKVAVMKDLESEIFVCKNKIQDILNQISVCEQRQREEHHRAHDIQNIIDRLFKEREDLNNRMHHLTKNYDHAVSDISKERAQLESHHKRHTQILTSKALFQSLEMMVLARKQVVINEFFNYCKFDQNCHRVLRQFSQILLKCGQYQMKMGLKTWFMNTFKPTQTIQQNYQLSANLYDSKLKQRAFSRFREGLNKRDQSEDNIYLSVQKLWRFKVKDVQKDIRRSLQIWRDHTHLHSQRLLRLKFLLLRQRNNLRRQALMAWRSYSLQLDMAIRHHILSTEFASDQQKLIIINTLRSQTAMNKQMRLRRLAHLLKAWRDSTSYRKYMMAQNVQAGHLRQSINQRLASACFQTLRNHKEHEKHILLLQNLEGDCKPAMDSLKQSIENICDQEFRQRKLRSLRCLSNRLLSKVGSYFNFWRQHTVNVDYKIRVNLRELIERRYRNQIHLAFDMWSKGFQFSKRIQQQSQIEDLSLEGKDLRNANFSLGKTVEEEKNRQDKNARTGITRATNIMKRRMLLHGLKRWSEMCQRKFMMEQKAALIIKKKRKNLCLQAVEIYKSKIQACRQADLDEARLEFQSITIAQRRKRQIFNAFYRYVTNYSKAKNQLGVLVNKIEIWLQRRTFIRWADKGNLKTEQILKQNQNTETNRFDDLNTVLGGYVNNFNDASSENAQIIGQLKRQGQRILANVFARFYYSNAARGIRKWRQVVENKQHLENIVKSAIDHNRRKMFYFAKAVVQNYIAKCKIMETKGQIHQTLIDTNNTIQLIQYNRNSFQEQQRERALMTERVIEKLERLKNKGSYSILMITKINNRNYYQSRLRFIFNCWSNFTKRQIQFCRSIEKVISKSLWQNGFDNINAFSRDKKLTRHQNVAIQDMRKLFWRKNCERAISLLKTKTFNNLVQMNRLTEETLIQNVQNQERTLNQFQEQRVGSGLTKIQTDQRKNLMRAWLNAVRFQKHIEQRSYYHEELQQSYSIQQTLRKWLQRVEHTAKCTALVKRFKERQRLMIEDQVFSGWKKQFNQDKQFANKLKIIAFKFDVRAKQAAMQMIRKFSESRQQINNLDKNVAAQSLFTILHHLHQNKMTDYLSSLRVKVVDRKLKNLVISSMFGHWYSRDLRRRFLHWRDQSKKATTVIDVNETGPIVEEVLEAQQQWTNQLNFMRDQGYTQKEMDEFAEKAKDFSKNLISKTVARFNHVTGDSYLIPKMFARWRQFVQMRKLLRYILRNIENKLQPVKADLSVAFNRWKFTTVHKNQELDGIDRGLLVKDLALKQGRLNQLNSLESKANSFLTTMGLQREELIENYLKSQRLAIAAGRDNLERGMHKGFSAMIDHSHQHKRTHFEAILQRNISLISSLKEKIRDFEFDNQELANENEELRQFSLDGYQIAKGVQSLSDERERLSVDLADKAQIIKGLLDENEALSIRLRQAQEAAVTLIQQSNLNLQRIQMSQASLIRN